MSLYETTEVEGRLLKIWSPMGEAPGLQGYVISDEGGWLDGIYDSKEAAIMGFKLTMQPNGYEKLAKMNKRIVHYTNEDRPITVKDFEDNSNE